MASTCLFIYNTNFATTLFIRTLAVVVACLMDDSLTDQALVELGVRSKPEVGNTLCHMLIAPVICNYA